MTLPIRLGKQPLVEALLEMRFAGLSEPLADVIPGMVFSELPGRFKRSEVLPLGSIPREVREQDPNLQFRAYHRLIGDRFVLSIGDQVITLSRLAPYGGWDEFRGVAEVLLDTLAGSDLTGHPIRFSLKSINIIPALLDRQLEMIKLEVTLGDQRPEDHGFRLRTELRDDRFVRIVEITPNAFAATRHGREFEGLRLDIDCIRSVSSDGSLQIIRDELDDVHMEAKRLFFSLLTEETLEALEPAYDE